MDALVRLAGARIAARDVCLSVRRQLAAHGGPSDATAGFGGGRGRCSRYVSAAGRRIGGPGAADLGLYPRFANSRGDRRAGGGLFHLELLLGPGRNAADQVDHFDVGGRGSAALLRTTDRHAARTEGIMRRVRWMIAVAGLALILVLANWDIV